jgi:hypothetical protein
MAAMSARIAVGCVAASVVLGGCGTGSSATTSPAAPRVATASTQAKSTPKPTVSPTRGTVPSPNAPPDFVLLGRTSTHERVRVEGRLGRVVPPSQSDADQAVLHECTQGNDRELVARLDLTTTVESGLPSSVVIEWGFPTINGPRSGLVHANIFDFALSSGQTCNPDDLPASTIELGQLAPHRPTTFTLWIILNNAVTVKYPHPSETQLGKEWSLEVPTVRMNTILAPFTSVKGPRVLHCRRSAGPYDDPFISDVGTLPSAITEVSQVDRTPETLQCSTPPH